MKQERRNNILHEYGHCLCDYYKSGTDDLNEELLVNRFAVSIWDYAGFEKELRNLKAMLDEILDRIKSPVPAHMSFVDFYEQIWGTDQLMNVAVYGYFQFESVRMALEEKETLADVLEEMGIHKKQKSIVKQRFIRQIQLLCFSIKNIQFPPRQHRKCCAMCVSSSME